MVAKQYWSNICPLNNPAKSSLCASCSCRCLKRCVILLQQLPQDVDILVLTSPHIMAKLNKPCTILSFITKISRRDWKRKSLAYESVFFRQNPQASGLSKPVDLSSEGFGDRRPKSRWQLHDADKITSKKRKMMGFNYYQHPSHHRTYLV